MRASKNYEVLSLTDDDTVSKAAKSVTIVFVSDLSQIGTICVECTKFNRKTFSDRKLSELETTLPSTRTMFITDAAVVEGVVREKNVSTKDKHYTNRTAKSALLFWPKKIPLVQ